jgi:hypothetical protein
VPRLLSPSEAPEATPPRPLAHRVWVDLHAAEDTNPSAQRPTRDDSADGQDRARSPNPSRSRRWPDLGPTGSPGRCAVRADELGLRGQHGRHASPDWVNAVLREVRV